MNTAVARRLARNDRVVWIGKDGNQPAELGTITRITAHQVEVHWDDRTVTRYRRAHLHNLRHAKLISETVESGRKAAYDSPEIFHFCDGLRDTFADDRARPDYDTGVSR